MKNLHPPKSQEGPGCIYALHHVVGLTGRVVGNEEHLQAPRRMRPLHLPCKMPVSRGCLHLHLVAFTALNQCSNSSVWDAFSETTSWLLFCNSGLAKEWAKNHHVFHTVTNPCLFVSLFSLVSPGRCWVPPPHGSSIRGAP